MFARVRISSHVSKGRVGEEYEVDCRSMSANRYPYISAIPRRRETPDPRSIFSGTLKSSNATD